MIHAEPEKFAAAEGIERTQSAAPFVIGGFIDKDDHFEGELPVPHVLSFMVGGSDKTIVQGLDSFDPSTWPPLFIHYFFDIMAIIGILMAIVPILFFVSWKHHHRKLVSVPLMWLTLATGILSIVAVELGWMLAEIGRQPWTIRGIMLTKDAFTSSPTVIAYAIVFPIFYLVLFSVTMYVLIRHYRARND